MRLAIYGAGSLGTVLGAYLARNGVAVDLVTRNIEHVAALNAHGAHVVGKVDFTVPVHALLPAEMEGVYDGIFLLTKQLENPSVAHFLEPHLARNGMLCTMQNGLPEPGLASVFGEERVAGCAIAWGATLLGSGVVELTSEPDSLTFSLGMVGKSNPESLEQIAVILRNMGPVVIEQNFIGARWSKLLINTAFSGMATVLGCTFGDVVDNPLARRLAQTIMKECIDTARAAKVTIEPVQGKDIVRLFDYSTSVKRWISYKLIPLAMKKHRALKPSMLQDIEKGKPCEIEAINGVLSREASKNGISTPVNDTVVAIVHRIEAGEIQPGMGNLRFFA